MVTTNNADGIIIGCSFDGTYSSSDVYNGPIAGNNGFYIIGCYSSGNLIAVNHTIYGIATDVYNCNFIGCYTTAEFTGPHIYPITDSSQCNEFKANYHKATVKDHNGSLHESDATEIDGTTVTWASAVEAMNEAISEALNNLDCGNFKYVENTDEATKEARPYILVEIDN